MVRVEKWPFAGMEYVVVACASGMLARNSRTRAGISGFPRRLALHLSKCVLE